MSWLGLTTAIACGIVIGRQLDGLLSKYLTCDDAAISRAELRARWGVR